MKNKIELKDGSILLRQYTQDDVTQLYEAAKESTAEVWQWLEWCHPDLSMDECKSFFEEQEDNWAKRTAFNFGIFRKFDNLYLGGCGLIEIRPSDKVASIGYWVRTTQTGNGIAKAAILLLATFAFNELNLNRVELVIAAKNYRSIRVAEGVGAIREGILRNRYEAHGKVQEAYMYSLIPADMSRLSVHDG